MPEIIDIEFLPEFVYKRHTGNYHAWLRDYPHLDDFGKTQEIALAELLFTWDSVYTYNFSKMAVPKYGPYRVEIK